MTATTYEMKLIKPSIIEYEDLSNMMVYPSKFKQLFGAQPRPAKEFNGIRGRTHITPAGIDFGIAIPVIGIKRDTPILFGDKLYHGVLPIKHIEGNTYKCSIDHCEIIQIGHF